MSEIILNWWSWVELLFASSSCHLSHGYTRVFFFVSLFDSVPQVSVAISTMNFNNDFEIRVDDVNWRESGSFFQSFAAKSKAGKNFSLSQRLNCIRRRKSQQKKKLNNFVFKIGWNGERAAQAKTILSRFKSFSANEYTTYLVSRYCLKSRRYQQVKTISKPSRVQAKRRKKKKTFDWFR